MTLTKKTTSLTLKTPIQYIKGVGPKLAQVFEKRDLRTVEDLLNYFPRAYEDRRLALQVNQLVPNQFVSIKLQFIGIQVIPMGRTGKKLYDLSFQDSTGKLHCKYFRLPYRSYLERFQPYEVYRIVGRPIIYRGRLEFHHPEIRDVREEEEDQDQIIPVYTEIEGLSSSKISKIIQSLILELPKLEIDDPLATTVCLDYNLIEKKRALELVHQPLRDESDLISKMRASFQRRLIFEDFFWFELLMANQYHNIKKEKAYEIEVTDLQWHSVLKSLPFELTKAQKKVIDEILFDLKKEGPMSRLVQGDVGSGKTIVAFIVALFVIEAGYQVAFMAPTEILAEQHFLNAKKFFDNKFKTVDFLVGSSKASQRKTILDALYKGQTHLLIGTHALIEDPVVFYKLGLVIIDEQHRFGVNQRAQLKKKGGSPHFLVMTATPIPRTLALTLYGDFDVSTIDELPPGRTPIVTHVVGENKKNQVKKFILDQVLMGRQAYIVYPLIEESEKLDLKNAQDEYEKLVQEWPQIKIALLHGRMKPSEKEEIMESFRKGHFHILVSTTVIEVGVDVPNATLMLIEHAERFGLSQLHQLRGRVGRGQYKSHCILMTGYALSEEAKFRLSIMQETTDGFKIAEADLELRGPGDFLGSRQSGDFGFKMASLTRDVELLELAREAAFKILQKDPHLLDLKHKAIKNELLKRQEKAQLVQIG